MKRKIAWITLIVTAFILTTPGCTLLGNSTTAPTTNPTATTSTSFQTTQTDFVSVVAKGRPSVVAISTETSVRIFGRVFTQEGAGSGWIYSTDGFIVTNNHVVEGARTVTVTLQDGRTFSAVSIQTNAAADLAVIKINATNLPALNIGDSSKLQVGEWVVAIGNALGMGISATTGIVSAVGVSMDVSQGQTVTGLIQTDAAINPGNSGGPLVNLAGEVVGINSAKIAEVGVEGMGYAIGIDEALPIIQQLLKA
jgi:serine protease Do